MLPRAMALIEMRGVKKSFGSKQVYRGLDLAVERGESLVVIGGSGQGKSVMLKLLIGLLETDDGEIEFDGEQLTGANEETFARVRRRIAMLFQGAALFDSMSVRDNVSYGLREHYRSMTEAERDERVRESLAYVGLEGIESKWPSDLSIGMRKRVGLARALAIRPEVLLYDEPTTGLDPINVERINHLVRHLQKELGVTSIVVTHEMSTLFAVSDRVAMVQTGGMIFVGTTDELLRSTDPRVHDFVRGLPPANEDTASILRSAG